MAITNDATVTIIDPGFIDAQMVLKEPQALLDVLLERARQDEKWGEQNHNPYIYLAIHAEEVGELAEAILQTQFGGEKGGWANVRKEAVHAAATALALIECLDRDVWVPDDVSFRGRV